MNMRDYVKGMLEEFPIQFTPDETMPTLASDQLLSPSTSELQDQTRKEDFHTFVAKGLFLCKRARPDIHPATQYSDRWVDVWSCSLTEEQTFSDKSVKIFLARLIK